MDASSLPTIQDLLVENIPRELVLSLEEALEAASVRALGASLGMRDGHLANVLGQMRHFHLNEAFADALENAGASPSPVIGNSLVVGHAGIFRIARFSVNHGIWYNAKRSRLRRKLAEINRSIEQLVQPGLFESSGPAAEATVFVVTLFSGSTSHQPERPIDIQLAVPDSKMDQWLYCESINKFAQAYNKPLVQQDEAIPTLKVGVQKRNSNEGGIT